MPATDQTRHRAYLELLHHGLVFVRNHAGAGHIELCRIEAEHLHEVPTLLGDPNESRHEDYIRGTRGLYLDELRAIGAWDYLASVRVWYGEPWRVLAAAAGVGLDDRL